MLKLVIADDDEILLEGLTRAFDWSELDIQVVAGEKDGDKALQAVTDMEADILLTDIQMPNMDGLRLAKLLKEKDQHVSTIIMSAYDEFQYAQQALRLNVEDYLLKPIDLEQLKKVMSNVVKKRVERAQQQEEVQKLRKENRVNLEEHFYKKMLKSHFTQEEFADFMDSFENAESLAWKLLEVRLDELKQEEEKLQIIRSEAEKGNGKLLEWDGKKALFCFCCVQEEIEENVIRFKQKSRKKIKEKMNGDTISFINGSVTGELLKLSLTYETMQKVGAYQYTEGKEVDLSEADMEKYYNSNHALNKVLVEHLAKLAFLGDKKSILDYTGRLKANLRHVGNNSKIMLAFALSLFWGELNKNGMKVDIHLDKIQEQYNGYYKRIAESDTLDGAMRYFEKMVLEFSDAVVEKECLTNEELVKKAKGIIGKQFMNSELRLADVAVAVNLSPNYFSTVFKEITGQGFSDYLMEQRMKEAQRLIVTTRLRSSEIASRVGYDNPTYFSSIFKKYSGMTVSQYRSMILP